MRAINRKLLRDLWLIRSQAAAISLVIAAGTAMFVMSLTTLFSLEQTLERYYEQYRFAHVFAHLTRAPNTLIPRIAEIPGVARFQTRIVADVNLDVPEMREPAIGRLISIPDVGEPALNTLHLRRGRWIEPWRGGAGGFGGGGLGEVLVSEAFAEAHRLLPGDRVKAVINERLRELTIVGIALSPEYVYEIREPAILPDPKRFGVFWMGESDLAATFGMEGAFNSVTLTLAHGASQQAVSERLNALLDPYGGLGAFGREDQTSHRFVTGEIAELRVMSVVSPVIFLGVAAFLLHMVITRLVQTQRGQIGVLKAFGYSNAQVAEHFLLLVGMIVLAGVIVGAAAGLWLGRGLTVMYADFFRFPVFHYIVDMRALLPALLVSGAAGMLGALGAVRRAVKLPPAEAMRPEPPASFRPTLIERLGFQRLFTQAARMVLRNIERQPLRTSLSTLGIALAVAILVLGAFMEDVIDFVMDHEFHRVRRQEVTINFAGPGGGPVSSRAVKEVELMPAAMRAEPFRAVPVRLRSQHREHRIAIMGLSEPQELFRLVEGDGTVVDLPPDGLLLSAALAKKLRIAPGDVVTVEVLERDRHVREVYVGGTINDFIGLWAYMRIDALRGLMREQDAVSGVFLAADVTRLDELYAALKDTPRVTGVVVRSALLDAFRETIAETMLQMRMFFVVFAGIIAFGVVYNSARISLAERGRELATLRVIGFTRAEVSMMMLGELTVITLMAIPVGFLIGYGFAAALVAALPAEDYRFPLVISPATYAFAAGVIFIAAIGSGLIVRRRIDRLDLVSVLKASE